MKTKFFFAIIITILLTANACKKTQDNPAAPDNWSIFVYGLSGCGLCTDFEDQLDAENIPYTFYDIDTNNTARAEMMLKLDAAGIPPDSIHWPVVDVMIDSVSHMFIQPDLDKDIKPLIGM